MDDSSDQQLLRKASTGDSRAIGEIVSRYVDFVYAAALRQVRDPHLAEDVAQAVFVILWMKARNLPVRTVLHAWLFHTTRYAAANAIRTRERRARHEQRAAQMRSEQISDDAAAATSASQPIHAMLDEAIARLRESDRTAILLSFFARKTWREVGATIGISEEAARKRGERAIEKMRDYFQRRGVAMTNAGVLGAVQAVAMSGATAPPGLAHAITSACITSAPAVSGANLLVKGAIQMMTWTKIKLAGVVAAAVLATAAGSAVAIRYEARNEVTASNATAASNPLIAKLENGITVEVHALSQRTGDNRSWWNADGSPTEVRFDDSTSEDDPPHTHQMLLRIAGMEPGAGFTWLFSNAPNWSGQPARRGGTPIDDESQVITFRRADGAQTTDLKVAIAAGPYRTVASMQEFSNFHREASDAGEVIFSGMVNMQGSAALAYTENFDNHQRRIVAFDQNGKEHTPVGRGGERSAKLNLEIVHFDLPVEEIERVEFQVRPFDQSITMKDISLVPGKITKPTISIAGPTTAPSGK